MKVLLMCLMISVCLPVFGDVPTRAQFDALVANNPDLVYDMVVKLFILENADPIILIPQMMVIDMEDGSSNIQWNGNMAIEIGEKPNNLSYDVELEVSNVVSGYKPDIGLSWGWVAAGGAGVFLLGIIVGSIVSK